VGFSVIVRRSGQRGLVQAVNGTSYHISVDGELSWVLRLPLYPVPSL
jgi:hypothetical protein